jgi:hypothetical protein
VGEELWAARYDGPDHGDDRTYASTIDVSGNVVAAGRGDSGYGMPPDYLAIRYGLQGETLWVRTYDGAASGWDEAYGVAADGDGNSYVTGYSYVTATQPNCATIKYAPDGQRLWVALFGGPIANYGRGSGIALDGTGGVYVCGVSAFTPGAYGDYATIKYNAATGDTEWVRGYNGAGNDVDRALAIAVDRQACVYVTGESYGGIGTGNDIATIKYVQNGGVAESSELAVQQSALVAIPNPFGARTEIRLGLPRGGPALVRVLDVSGRAVRTLREGQSSSGWHSLVWDGTRDNGARVPAGVYMVVLNTGGASSMVKVTLLK